MSRNLPSGLADAFSGAKVSPVFLVDLEWPTGTVYAWNGYGQITWNGNVYLGVGQLGGISEVKESRDGGANGLTLSLTGIPSDMIAQALADDAQGRPARIWIGLMANDGTFTADPYLLFDGVIDVCPIQDDGQTATVSVQLEKELIDDRTRGRRYTHEDQQIEFPGDRGFEYVAGLQNKVITWGTATPPSTGQ